MTWGPVPAGTVELFLDFYDPDASGFSHWLVYAIPVESMGLPPVPGGAREGVNGFGHRGYGGPCPPRGQRHRYVLEVAAVDRALGLKAGATRGDLLGAARPARVLARGTVTATYGR